MSYTQCVGAIVSHAQEVCQQVLPVMEQSAISTHTSTIKVGEYTVTLTLSKKGSVLGKRRLEPIEEVSSQRPWQTRSWQTPSKEPSTFYPKPSSDSLLYNSLGHNFSHQNPHPPTEPVSVPFYIS
jgi:hypothetical protein